MKLNKNDLEWAASQGLIHKEQIEPLWNALENRPGVHAKFDMSHTLYYFGVLIVISAMSFFMTLGWEMFGGTGIFLIATGYGVFLALAGHRLWFVKELKIPGGLLFTAAVCMTPLAVYGLETMTGIWPGDDPGFYRGYHVWIKGSWLIMEIATLVAGLVALKYVRFPFLTAPIAFTLWYMSMDLTPLLFGREYFTYQERLWVSLWFGLAMLVLSFFIERKTKEDFSFWGYLFGMMAFWGGLSLMESDSELNKLLYCFINLILMLTSVFLQRRVFMIFGAMGVLGYIGHLAWRVFEHSMLFPFVLSLLGILIILAGIQYQRRQAAIEKYILDHTPGFLRKRLPSDHF
jgi:hypothetical protein